MTTSVAVFGYSGVVPNTVQCIVDEVKASPALLWAVASSDALISRSRSVVASRFLQSKADVLVMIDHDLVWNPGDVRELATKALQHDAIVAGLYSKRALRKGFASILRDEAPGSFMDIGADHVYEAKWLASGFTAYPRTAFEKVKEAVEMDSGQLTRLHAARYFDGHDFTPFFMPFMLGTDYLSEDWAFSERARRAGVKQLIWAKPKLLHIGEFPYSVVTA